MNEKTIESGAVVASVETESTIDVQKTAEQIADENYLNGLKTNIEITLKNDHGETEKPPMSDFEYATNLADLLGLTGKVIASPLFNLKHTGAVLNEENSIEVARSLVAVLKKYSWGLKILSFLERGNQKEEIALCFVLYSVGNAMAQGYYLDKQEAAKQQAAEKTEKEVNPANSEWQNAGTPKSSVFREAGNNA